VSHPIHSVIVTSASPLASIRSDPIRVRVIVHSRRVRVRVRVGVRLESIRSAKPQAGTTGRHNRGRLNAPAYMDRERERVSNYMY